MSRGAAHCGIRGSTGCGPAAVSAGGGMIAMGESYQLVFILRHFPGL